MLEDFLADELTLAIAVGGQPHPFGRAQCLSNHFKLGSFVAALGRASAVKALGPQKDWGPALPGRHHILRFEQIEQMALGRKNVSVARANGGADIFRLAGLFGDDNLIRHQGLVSTIGSESKP